MSKRKRNFLMVLGALAALLSILALKDMKTAGSNKTALGTTSQQIAAATSSLVSGPGDPASQIAAGAKEEEKAVPAEADAASLLRTISNAGTASGLKIDDVKFEAQGASPDGEVVTISASGTYTAAARFAGALQNQVMINANRLIIKGRLVRIDGITMTKGDAAAGAGSKLIIVVRATAPVGVGAAATAAPAVNAG